MVWLTGSPTVSITLNDYTTKLTAENPDLLMVFLAGWTKYELQNKEITDATKLNVKGVKSVLKSYGLGGAVKNKTLDKLAKMNENDLMKWVAGKLK